ncbi:thyroid hormone-inducible hepatic protein [Megalops cyprinoides]|uniref:thyroid hormone-inducible hepatic protein n=1 Tax=Megalops cyprinoides TaxID=118141 RepID=UPI001864A3B1|nr:thyroid hormone-inducible hepatic protein [Megalops cyprinoides]
MQSAEAKRNGSCLQLALRRYSAAVRDMEQTVMLPSLLREVASEDNQECAAAEEGTPKDLYEYYLMLKTIRNTVESGLIPMDDRKAKNQQVLSKTMEPLLDADPEVLFHFHLKGLFAVISSLTTKSQSLTAKYMDMVGIAN